ncbi:MAG: hypothetical protein ACNA8K_00170 [Cyclonatronaceae bacterium]
MIRSLTSILMALLFVTACGSTQWNTDNRQMRGDRVAITLSPEFRLENSSTYAGKVAVSRFQQGALDSLMQTTLSRYISGMSRGGRVDADFTPVPGEADVLLVIEKLEISRVFSLDFVLRGPVTRVKMDVAGLRGSERIFETTVSGSQNMAYVARNGRRFYWMKEEDKNDPDYQLAALADASRTALGKVYSRFFDQ